MIRTYCMQCLMLALHEQRSKSAIARYLAFALFLLLAGATSARAQVTARIKGTITDPSAAAVASASITLRNTETGATRTVSSESDGTYLFLALPVGTYEIAASKSGFQDSVRTGLQLNVNQEVSVDLRLQVSFVRAAVTVSGDAPIVSTTTSDFAVSGNRPQQNMFLLNGVEYTGAAENNMQPGGPSGMLLGVDAVREF